MTAFTPVGLSAAIFYLSKVIDNLRENEMLTRSAILMTLGQQDSFTSSTAQGKPKLQKDLKDATNAVLRQRTGFGGIDNVYFTRPFIKQAPTVFRRHASPCIGGSIPPARRSPAAGEIQMWIGFPVTAIAASLSASEWVG